MFPNHHGQKALFISIHIRKWLNKKHVFQSGEHAENPYFHHHLVGKQLRRIQSERADQTKPSQAEHGPRPQIDFS